MSTFRVIKLTIFFPPSIVLPKASSTAVKAAYDLANGALPKTGGTISGALEIGSTASLVFEGSSSNDFETTLAVTDPTADRTITLPNLTGTVALLSDLDDGSF